jgi:hypothetical protein
VTGEFYFDGVQSGADGWNSCVSAYTILARLQPPRLGGGGLEMSNPKIWYVSSEVYVTRRHVRSSLGFESESEAKQFAKLSLAAGNAVYAGTINPHTPKRFVPPEKVLDWVNEVDASSKEESFSARVKIGRGNDPGAVPA